MEDNMKKMFTIITVSILFILPAISQEGLTFQGFLRHETAVSTAVMDETEYVKSLTDLSLVGKHYAGDYRFYVDLYCTYDSVNGDEGEVELREGYVAADFDNTSFIAGKQWIAWGRADEINPVDVINPEDYSEPLVRGKGDRKIRVTALSISKYLGDYTLNMVFVPDFTPPAYETNSHWSTGLASLIQEYSLYYAQQAVDLGVPSYRIENYVSEHLILEDKENSVNNAQYGFRLSGYLLDTDFSLYYYRGFWSDLSRPVIFVNNYDIVTGYPESVMLAFPEFKMYGADLEKALGPYTVRAEAAYYAGRYISYDSSRIGSPEDISRYVADRGAGKSNVLKVVAGMDRFWGNFYVNAQYVTEYITNYDKLMMLPEELLHSVTLKVSDKFVEDKLEPEVKLVYEITENDLYLAPSVSYELYDGIAVKVAWDILTGDESGTVGQYKDCDQFKVQLKYNF